MSPAVTPTRPRSPRNTADTPRPSRCRRPAEDPCVRASWDESIPVREALVAIGFAARDLVQLHRWKGFGEQFARGLHGPVFELAVVELRAARGARHRFVSTGIGTADEIAAATLRTLNAEIHDPPRWLDAAIGPALRALGLDCSGISIVHRRLGPSSAARHTTWSGRPWPPYSVKHGRTLGGRSCANVMVRSEPERARSSVRWSRRRSKLRRYSRPPLCRPRSGDQVSAFRWRRQEIRIAREKPCRIGLLAEDRKSVPGAHQWSASGIGDDRYVQ